MSRRTVAEIAATDGNTLQGLFRGIEAETEAAVIEEEKQALLVLGREQHLGRQSLLGDRFYISARSEEAATYHGRTGRGNVVLV